MAWTKMGEVPNPIFDTNGDPYAGAVLKVYLAGTTTTTPVGINKNGTSTQATLTANANGVWEVSGNEVSPFIDRECKWGIFANATDAAANTPFYMGPFDFTPQSVSGQDPQKTFETVADMVASTTLNIGDHVKTLGYTAIGDGGDNEYDIVAAATGTADGGSYINLATHQAKGLFPGGVHNVKQFGAVGDEVTDDATAIQAAVDSGNKSIFFPEGTYLVNSTIVLPKSDILTIFGAVARNCIIKTSSAIDIMDIAGSLGNSLQYVTIKDLTFNADNTSAVGVRTRHTEFLKISNCVFIGNAAATGLYMSENANEQDVKPTITNCNFGNTGYGIRSGDTRVADIILCGNYFLNNIVRSVSFGYLDGGSIRSNKFFSDNGATNTLEGLRIGRPVYCVIEDNAFFEMGGEAISLTSPRRCRILYNQIVGVGDNANEAAISITDYDASIVTSDVEITGNIIREVEGHGIYAYSANTNMEKIKITKNFMYDIGSGAAIYDAINLKNISQFDIYDNIIEGNSTTRYWLYLDAAIDIKLRGNTHTGCINSDVYRINNPTMIIEDSRRVLSNVTATTNIEFDIDSVIGGSLSASITMNLPSATSCLGKIITFTKSDVSGNSIILDPAASQTIDGATTLSISTQYQTVTLMSDGANWVVV